MIWVRMLAYITGTVDQELPITLSNNSRLWDCRSFPVLPRPAAGPPTSEERISGRREPHPESPNQRQVVVIQCRKSYVG
jgi:hypothetical protein